MIWHFLGRPSTDEIKDTIKDIDLGNLTDFFDDWDNVDFTDFWDEDPFVGNNSTYQWDTGGKREGLSLVIQNALDESWQDEFTLAIDDWENGDPDALTLTKKKVAIDPVKFLLLEQWHHLLWKRLA